MPTSVDIPLFIDQLSVDSEFEITRIHGGRRANQRLAELGLPVGAHAKIIERHPLIVRVGETRLALGRGLAGKVEVRLISGDSETRDIVGRHQAGGRNRGHGRGRQ